MAKTLEMIYKKTLLVIFIIIVLSSCGRKGDVKRIIDKNVTAVPASIDYKRTYKY